MHDTCQPRENKRIVERLEITNFLLKIADYEILRYLEILQSWTKYLAHLMQFITTILMTTEKMMHSIFQ